MVNPRKARKKLGAWERTLEKSNIPTDQHKSILNNIDEILSEENLLDLHEQAKKIKKAIESAQIEEAKSKHEKPRYFYIDDPEEIKKSLENNNNDKK